ncbi:MAG: Glu/Leu/Phe/Val dehydrogenase [Kiloniellales bacterium]
MAILVVDNVAAGPAIGGLRMAEDVTTEECFRLARAMTLKNAAAGLSHGGAKSAILANPHAPVAEKEGLLRAFAAAIADIRDYIPGPDLGTDEACMAWVHDEIGRSVGLPAALGGIPLDQIGATGFGLGVAVEVARRFCDLELQGARVVVQGFGSVGQHAARFLADKGAILIAAADSSGTVMDEAGLDLEALIALKQSGQSLDRFRTGKTLARDAVVDIACDIWIPAARPDVINEENVARLKTKIVAQGANIAVTAKAEEILHARNILSIPDFIANAGGVICAAVEFAGGTHGQAFEAIEDKISRNTWTILDISRRQTLSPRAAAVQMAHSRVRAAMSFRRWA